MTDQPFGKIFRIESDMLDDATLSIDKDKIGIILGGMNLSDFDSTFSAENSVKETINQTIVSFPVTRRNGTVLQVTGTDDRNYSFDGLLLGTKAKNQKILLDALLKQGVPLSLTLFYNNKMQKVLIKNLTWQVEKDCQIRYSIDLVEYYPEVLVFISGNVQAANRDWTGDDSTNTDQNTGSKCEDTIVLCGTKTQQIKFGDLVKAVPDGGSELDGASDFAKALTRCWKDLGVSETVYNQAIKYIQSLINGMYLQLFVFLSTNVEISTSSLLPSGLSYDFWHKCLGKYTIGSKERALFLSKVFGGIFNKCNGSQKVSVVINGIKDTFSMYTKDCLSKEFFERIAGYLKYNGNEYVGEKVVNDMYITIQVPTILISPGCYKWCKGIDSDPSFPPTEPPSPGNPIPPDILPT